MDALKLTPEQLKALQDTGAYEAPKKPQLETAQALPLWAQHVVRRIVLEKVMHMGRTKYRLFLWTSQSAMRWHMWAWRNYRETLG
jgi:hypothetical protein